MCIRDSFFSTRVVFILSSFTGNRKYAMAFITYDVYYVLVSLILYVAIPTVSRAAVQSISDAVSVRRSTE